MQSLEEYIARRKKEDHINEFNVDERMENVQICVNYVFEYFNQYLNIDEMEQKTFLNDERLNKFRNQLGMYEKAIQDWLINIYDVHEKHIHRSIISILKKDDIFFLYHTESEFRSCSYGIYAELIKKNPFLKDQTEMLFQFIKDYHRIQSQKEVDNPPVFLTEEITEWIDNTWAKYKVSIWAFVSDYIHRFSDDDSLWPAKHKVKNTKVQQYFDYDFKQKTNLFNLNSLYPRISHKPFMKGKKQYLELLMMHTWLHSIESDDGNYWDEYFDKFTSK
ncbi:hypothetical protein [Lysinibacillus telephonicus]|uniref:Uncharacterized protein n=1 Tax=Lysinibacillus telephonicus TaxID=1714840 RepID=A0A3S0HEZ3_9BACI|nr:hypothetical protein [Lysinibacillus telephonicus]RTQ87114.1 hypothetical protein EKG35_19395 [Lysinibacillus telephonicus]